ncbi:tetratricopeptide repeat protein [Lysobacter sp. TAF61]|uniref:tetratricopeptide repeat protein n=1 Tax=Lysobacter sp. TAF61 TaxID=3233072 RepID=UPI003F9ADABA
MTRRLSLHVTLQLALLALAAPAAAAGPATPDFDAAQAWQQFLAHGEFEPATKAFDLMDTVSYDGEHVDAAACTQHRDVVASSVAAAPISIVVRRIAYMCAQATGDDAAAEREMTALAALSRYALGQAGDPGTSKPIRVLGASDATALVMASGMDVLSVTYDSPRPERYFPLVIVGWDAEAKVERHLTFDYIDTMYQISRSEPGYGFPVLRNGLVVNMIDGASNEPSARDVTAVRKSRETDDIDEKLEVLRPAARDGGLRSAFEWAQVCGTAPTTACGEGFVDALLPRAEQKQALSMVLLAYAHLQGLGVARDEATAWTLLDAADRRWPNYGATAEFTRLWLRMHEDPIPDDAMPPALQKRLDRAAAEGNRFARREALRRKVLSKAKPKLDADELAFLAEPAENGNGAGFALLADYYDREGQPQLERQWQEKSADAGTAMAQATYGSALIFGDGARDAVRGEQYVVLAAHGGVVWAMRHRAELSLREGQWAQAEKWLLPAAYMGDFDALFDIADLYARDEPGLQGNAADAVRILKALADGSQAGRARASLADMALAGRGMKKDPQQALQWLLPVAEKGDLYAQARLGMSYLWGDFGKVDEAKAMRWLKAPLAARQPWASTFYGSWLFHHKGSPQTRAQAIVLWQQGADGGMTNAYNELAWAACTSPYPDTFNPAMGMQAVAKMAEPTTLDLPELDTVAACHAAAGDFKRAVELQALALERADAMAVKLPDYKEMADGFRERLALYRADRHYVQDEKKAL